MCTSLWRPFSACMCVCLCLCCCSARPATKPETSSCFLLEHQIFCLTGFVDASHSNSMLYPLPTSCVTACKLDSSGLSPLRLSTLSAKSQKHTTYICCHPMRIQRPANPGCVCAIGMAAITSCLRSGCATAPSSSRPGSPLRWAPFNACDSAAHDYLL